VSGVPLTVPPLPDDPDPAAARRTLIEESVALNREMWDERAPAHAGAPEYAVARFVADPTYLSDVVAFDRPLLGDLAGCRGVHLQCHIGTDTLSLARLGAEMTGLDFSAPALEEARRLAAATGTTVDYVLADVRRAAEVLPAGAFDLVFTGIGALCWVPDVAEWARVVATLLAPGGRLFMREGHPVLWALDTERDDDLLVLRFPYFGTGIPLEYTSRDGERATYVTTDVPLTVTRSRDWNRGLGEIVSALLAEGLVVTGLVEHDSVPWEALPGRMTPVGGGEWRLADQPERLPHSYTLQARRPA
jgi:SAM-dependent methyltransferase